MNSAERHSERSAALEKVRSRSFQRMFLKNVCLTFLCCLIPLLAGAITIYRCSNETLLQEINMANERTLGNARQTLEILLAEAKSVMSKCLLDGDVLTFIKDRGDVGERTYQFYTEVNRVQSVLSRHHKQNLYYSVDVYSSNSDMLVSSVYMGQSRRLLYDATLIDEFRSGAQEGAWAFARRNLLTVAVGGEAEQVITLYHRSNMSGGALAFVSVSIVSDVLADYITDADASDSRFCIVDADDEILFDSRGGYEGASLALDFDGAEGHVLVLDGEETRVSWARMDEYGWRLALLVPMSEYLRSMSALRTRIAVILSACIAVAAVLAYLATKKLFRPVAALIQLVNAPTDESAAQQKGEIQYLLMQVLSSFQKNIVLEKQMLSRATTLRQARAKALQKQLSSHFLYNSLQAVNWLALAETHDENSRTSQAVTLLADIIRTTMEQESNFVRVRDEISYTQRFMEIEKLRSGDDIIAHYDVDPDTLDLPLLSVSIQTLAENAVSHALRPKGGGNLYIGTCITPKGLLNIRVEDDGDGMPQEEIDRVMAQLQEEYVYPKSHMGLINLFQRFRLCYGEGCVFDLGRGEHGGLLVSITLPPVEMDEEKQ